MTIEPNMKGKNDSDSVNNHVTLRDSMLRNYD